MRYAIISDLHANWEALTATLAAIDELKVDEILCLGDLVGYFTNPNECVELIRARNILCIAGNHDTVAAGIKEPVRFGPRGKRAIEWTREQLTPDNRRFLQSLPLTKWIDDAVLLVHGTLHPEPNEDIYLTTNEQAAASLAEMPKLMPLSQLCFFGHTHRALIYEQRTDQLTRKKSAELRLKPDASYLINPGSVGQPRDHDPRAAFVIYDNESRTVQFHRVAFDCETAERKAQLAGLIPRETYYSRAENLVMKWRDTGVDLMDRYRGKFS